MTDAAVSALGYIEVGATDLAAWQGYAEAVLGVAVENTDDSLRLRMDSEVWRIQLVASDTDDLQCIGFKVKDGATLSLLQTKLEAIGVDVESATADQAAARSVEQMLHCVDPNGIRVELYVGDRTSEQAFVSPQQVSSFVTGEQGLGHIVLFVPDEASAITFYQQGLGFLLSDHINMGPAEQKIKLTFLHCNPRHHTLALVPVPVPKRLNHIMLQVGSLDDVGFGLDRATNHGVPISSTLGCHTNDKMVSFYMKTPSGFDIEYGYGGVEIDDETWQPVTYDAPSIWGHKGSVN